MIPIEKLRGLCKAKNSSIKKMEEDLGIGNGVIAKWYKRGTDPSHARICQIAEYLSVSADYIATGVESSPGDFGERSAKDQRLISWFLSLPEEKRKAILILEDGPEDLL